MLTPPVVSGQSYPGGDRFAGAFQLSARRSDFCDRLQRQRSGTAGPNSVPVSDVSYSVWPTIALDQTTTRLHWTLNYAPGFTFYQHTSSRNEADQNAAVNFQYRLSPHVTFSAVDSFQKSSNVFNQPDLGSAGAVSGGAQAANLSVIAPVADRLSNNGNVGMTYQFAANAMIGAERNFLEPALSRSKRGAGPVRFRVRRAGRRSTAIALPQDYLGVTYQYQRLLAFPTQGENETQTHAVLFFYTYNRTPEFTLSLFGGPQHSDTVQTERRKRPRFSLLRLFPCRRCGPGPRRAARVRAGRGRFTSFALSYIAHRHRQRRAGWGGRDRQRQCARCGSR